MGAEQSGHLTAQKVLRTHRDVDISYASLSMNNPIDTSDNITGSITRLNSKNISLYCYKIL